MFLELIKIKCHKMFEIIDDDDDFIVDINNNNTKISRVLSNRSLNNISNCNNNEKSNQSNGKSLYVDDDEADCVIDHGGK